MDDIHDWAMSGTPLEYMFDDEYIPEEYMDERWKETTLPNVFVSDHGRFYNASTKNFLKPTHGDSHGHRAVKVSTNGCHYQKYAHRLIAEAFIPRSDGLTVVRHLNDIPDDNEIENLAWGTVRDNINDAKINGKSYTFTAEDREKSYCKSRTPVIAKEISSGKELYFRSQNEAARELGVAQANIYKVLVGERQMTCGYSFKYAGGN